MWARLTFLSDRFVGTCLVSSPSEKGLGARMEQPLDWHGRTWVAAALWAGVLIFLMGQATALFDTLAPQAALASGVVIMAAVLAFALLLLYTNRHPSFARFERELSEMLAYTTAPFLTTGLMLLIGSSFS